MILDHIDRIADAAPAGEAFRKAFEFLSSSDFSQIESGRIELDGDRLFALVQRYDSKPCAEGFWEAHRRYIDVQYIAAGREKIGFAPISALTADQPYAPDRDLATYNGQGDFFTAVAGTVAVFFPHDAHMPSLALQDPEPVLKVVVKIRCSPE